MKKKLGAAAILLVVGFGVGRYHRGSSHSSVSVRRVLYYVDPMHPAYRSNQPGIAPDCGMQLEPVYAPDSESAPQAAATAEVNSGAVAIDRDMQRALGIELATVQKSSAPQLVRVLGHVAPEDTLVYRVDSGTDGFIRDTYDDSVGIFVKKDQTLATCYGPEYLSVASGFLAATAGVPGAAAKDGARTMPFPGAVAKQGVSSLQGYTDRLRNLGMSEFQIRQMAENHQLPETVDIVSPADGFILARNVSPGQHFDRAMEFYRIADLSKVWIMADVFEAEAARIRPGAMARIRLRDGSKTLTAR